LLHFLRRLWEWVRFLKELWELWLLLTLIGAAGLLGNVLGIWGSIVGVPQAWLVGTAVSVFVLVVGVGGGAISRWRLRRFPRLELTPSSGPNEYLLLNVFNHGASNSFSAQCRLIDQKSPNPPTQGTFDLAWEGRAAGWKEIPREYSANLLIAQFRIDHGMQMGGMALIRGNDLTQYTDEVWNFGDAPKSFPQFNVQVRVVGLSLLKARSRYYLIRPTGQYGPLEMAETDKRFRPRAQ
jgi:hypothetical protein